MLFYNTIIYLTTIFITIYFYFQYKFTYWSRQHLPYLPPEFPYGNTKSLIRLEKCFAECFIEIYQKMKKITTKFGGIYMFSRPSLMIMDPDLIKTILTKDFNSFQDRGMYLDEKTNPLNANLILLRGAKWKNLRSKLSPTFSSAKMKMVFDIMLECSEELCQIVNVLSERNLSIDIRDIFARLTTDTIGACAFGIQCNSLRNPNAEFRQYGRRVFEVNFRIILVNILATNFPFLLRLLKISQFSPDVTEFFIDVLQQTVNYREMNHIERNDFLNLLIKLKNTNDNGFSFNELAAQAFAFFTAGFETSSSTLTFGLYELVMNQSVQSEVRNEVLLKLNKYDNKFTYDCISEMKYLDKVISEVLRKYPPIPTLQRECTNEYKIPNSEFTIKKGTKIVIPTMGIHLDENYFPNPDKFDPERFNEEEKSKRHPYTYLPFGEGPRICIGMRFAQLQIKLALAVLLKNFKFEMDPKTIMPIKFDPKSVFLSPLNTILIKAVKIEP